jgi:hypothetical protein
MSDLRRSDRKRSQTQFEGATQRLSPSVRKDPGRKDRRKDQGTLQLRGRRHHQHGRSARRVRNRPPQAAPHLLQAVLGAGGVQGSSSRGTAAATAANSAKAVQEVYERFETAFDDLDSGLFDADDQHCYCCMQFFGGAGNSKSLLKDGHRWCLACSYQVHGLGARGGTPSSRPPRAPTTAAVAALAARREVAAPLRTLTTHAHARIFSDLFFKAGPRQPSPASPPHRRHAADTQNHWLHTKGPRRVLLHRWNYHKERELGHGNFSRVYRVVHRLSACAFAMKTNREPICTLQSRNTWLNVSAQLHGCGRLSLSPTCTRPCPCTWIADTASPAGPLPTATTGDPGAADPHAAPAHSVAVRRVVRARPESLRRGAGVCAAAVQ